jgi:predicted nucleic acid-binding Zn ribbon protein
MPIYLFQHPKTKEVKEIIQRMSESHTFIDDKGVSWTRIFVNPQVAFNTQISATDSKSFVEKTRGKNYSLGQLWDMSAELSAKREGMSGVDEVRVKAEDAYKKKTQKKHPHAKKKSLFQV